ncbi:MAG: hypothetical protein K2X65_01970 [Burkholderiaceae bacterium]|jgi:hypothetical protein|nr:hypothetical protein [Burkholderiaceae bacterium]
MNVTELLNYPGTWAWLAVVAVLMGGLVVFAVALRRTLRSPPLDEQHPSPSSSAPSKTASGEPEKPQNL